jgi:hypothetical protein
MKIIKSLPILGIIGLLIAACGPAGTPFAVEIVQADPADPASVVNAYFTARSAFKTDAALQYIPEGTVITNPFGTFTGIEEIKTEVIEDSINENVQFTMQNPQVNGERVNFTAQVYVNGQATDLITGQAVVQNGKIVAMTLEYNE